MHDSRLKFIKSELRVNIEVYQRKEADSVAFEQRC